MMSNPPKIFLVDDDLDDAMLLKEAIQSTNDRFTFEHSLDGRTALELLKKAATDHELPCLVVLDINMPVLDGRELLAILKKEEELKKVPVVVFTTSSNPADLNYCKKFGVELIVKPFNMSMLKDIAKKILPYCAA